MTWHTLLKIGLFVLIVPVWIYGQYFRERSMRDRRDEKADVETLFGGKK